MKLGLVADRHDMKVVDFIFKGKLEDPTKIKDMDKYCLRFFSDIKTKLKAKEKIEIYVTGCTPALICAINSCKILGLDVVLWHFNSFTKNYFKQEVI